MSILQLIATEITVTDLIEFIDQVKEIYYNWGIIAAIGLPLFETLVPIVPLFLMISLNILTYGLFWGFIFTYIGTTSAAILIFILMRSFSTKPLGMKLRRKNKVEAYLEWIENTHPMLHIISMMIPLSPAYLINYSMGLSNVKFSTYLIVTLISRFLMLIFCIPFAMTLITLYQTEQLGGVQALWLLIFGCIVIVGIVLGQKRSKRLETQKA